MYVVLYRSDPPSAIIRTHSGTGIPQSPLRHSMKENNQEWCMIHGFLFKNADQQSAQSIRITWSGKEWNSNETPRSIVETITQRAKYLKRLGRRRRWPPPVRRENQLKESDSVGHPTQRPHGNLRAKITTYHSVTCSVQSHQGVMNPVPTILHVLTPHPTISHACTARALPEILNTAPNQHSSPSCLCRRSRLEQV